MKLPLALALALLPAGRAAACDVDSPPTAEGFIQADVLARFAHAIAVVEVGDPVKKESGVSEAEVKTPVLGTKKGSLKIKKDEFPYPDPCGGMDVEEPADPTRYPEDQVTGIVGIVKNKIVHVKVTFDAAKTSNDLTELNAYAKVLVDKKAFEEKLAKAKQLVKDKKYKDAKAHLETFSVKGVRDAARVELIARSQRHLGDGDKAIYTMRDAFLITHAAIEHFDDETNATRELRLMTLYNLICYNALKEYDEPERDLPTLVAWLTDKAERAKYLKLLETDKDLDFVRGKPWFRKQLALLKKK